MATEVAGAVTGEAKVRDAAASDWMWPEARSRVGAGTARFARSGTASDCSGIESCATSCVASGWGPRMVRAALEVPTAGCVRLEARLDSEAGSDDSDSRLLDWGTSSVTVP